MFYHSFISRILKLLKQGRIQGEGAGGAHPPPPEMTCGFLIQLVSCKKKKKTMWFIGVEVEQKTSAPPPKKILDPPLQNIFIFTLYISYTCVECGKDVLSIKFCKQFKFNIGTHSQSRHYNFSKTCLFSTHCKPLWAQRLIHFILVNFLTCQINSWLSSAQS